MSQLRERLTIGYLNDRNLFVYRTYSLIRIIESIMEIDLENDLRREEDDDDESDEERRRDESDNEESKTTDVEKVMKKANEVAKKKVARRPRPKLDVDRLVILLNIRKILIYSRLTGPKGLGELCKLFKEEKFQGKEHEVIFNFLVFSLVLSLAVSPVR